MFIAVLLKHLLQMLLSGPAVTFAAFRIAAYDISLQYHMAEREILFIGSKIHIIKSRQLIAA